MGKGKGSFDHWASRVAVSRIIFELKGDLHEQIVRDAFRLAGNKLPGENSITNHMAFRANKYRIVRICEEGRPSGRGNHEDDSGSHTRGYEKASPESSSEIADGH